MLLIRICHIIKGKSNKTVQSLQQYQSIKQIAIFGMITTGGSFVFIKLLKGETPQYALSRVFELNNPGNDLYTVLGILKQLVQDRSNSKAIFP